MEKGKKTCFVGIPKSGFTTNLRNKLISSWKVFIVKIVIPNPSPHLFGMYVYNYFSFICQFIAKDQKH